MEYILTRKAQFNKKCKDSKSRSYLIYFLNDVEIFKQKLPYDENYVYGSQHQTRICDDYLLNGKVYQTRSKDNKTRFVSFPVSKNKLIGIPDDHKILLTKII